MVAKLLTVMVSYPFPVCGFDNALLMGSRCPGECAAADGMRVRVVGKSCESKYRE